VKEVEVDGNEKRGSILNREGVMITFYVSKFLKIVCFQAKTIFFPSPVLFLFLRFYLQF